MDASTVWTPQLRSCFDSGGLFASINKQEPRNGYSGLLDQSTEQAPSRDRSGLWRRAACEGSPRGAAREGAARSRYLTRVLMVKRTFLLMRRGIRSGWGEHPTTYAVPPSRKASFDAGWRREHG